MRVEYTITYDAPYDQELMNKLAETAANHIDPKTNGNFMGGDACSIEYINGKMEVNDWYTQFRIN